MNTIRIIDRSKKVLIHFTERGENFTTNVPHAGVWTSTISYLRNRGFKVTNNHVFEKQFKALADYHRIGKKANKVIVLMELGADSIELHFGNLKNLWLNSWQSFWNDQTDERHSELSYLEHMAVELEIYKAVKFFEKLGHTLDIESENLPPAEYIIAKEKRNPHIHDANINTLEDIKASIKSDSYNFKHNSNDANDKKIICGQQKYFYSYTTKRLSCGIVWHNINNMWWVIAGSKLYNIAAFNLFDYSKDLPRRKPLTKGEYKGILKRLENSQEYLRCHHLNEFIKNKFKYA